VTNLLLKNFWLAWYALIPRAIFSLISPSIELLSFMMDPSLYIVELALYVSC